MPRGVYRFTSHDEADEQGLAVLADSAAAEVRDTNVREFVVVRVADEVSAMHGLLESSREM